MDKTLNFLMRYNINVLDLRLMLLDVVLRGNKSEFNFEKWFLNLRINFYSKKQIFCFCCRKNLCDIITVITLFYKTKGNLRSFMAVILLSKAKLILWLP